MRRWLICSSDRRRKSIVADCPISGVLDACSPHFRFWVQRSLSSLVGHTLAEPEIRAYFLTLVHDRQASRSSVVVYQSALRFFVQQTLG